MKILNKKGFTLAEMLITLSIICVVAVLTLSMLRTVRPDRENIMYKKAYNLLGRCVYELINDEELYSEGRLDDTGTVNYMGTSYTGTSKFCGLVAAKMNLSGDADCSQQIEIGNGGNFTTTDGIVWDVPPANFSNRVTVNIDVNGTNPPNCVPGVCAANVTPDRYTITVSADGRMTAPLARQRDFRN